MDSVTPAANRSVGGVSPRHTSACATAVFAASRLRRLAEASLCGARLVSALGIGTAMCPPVTGCPLQANRCRMLKLRVPVRRRRSGVPLHVGQERRGRLDWRLAHGDRPRTMRGSTAEAGSCWADSSVAQKLYGPSPRNGEDGDQGWAGIPVQKRRQWTARNQLACDAGRPIDSIYGVLPSCLSAIPSAIW